jgi:hypothetical protein
MALILTRHARARMARDGINEIWVERTILYPEHAAPNPDDPMITRAWRRIPELGGRIVRVVFYAAGPDFVVVTAFLDRGARRWLP